MDGLAKLKPYTFWLVTGVVLLAMLIYFGFVLAAVDEDGNTVEDVVAGANLDYAKLKDLDQQAREVLKYDGRRIPDREIEPEAPEDVKSFIKKHLMHPSWTGRFEEVLQDYQGQIASIRADLAQRSAALTQPPVSQASEPSQWYDDYQDQTTALLREMYESRRLAVPATWTGARPMPGISDLETKEELRSPAGLWTKTGTSPPEELWPQLTARFRVVQALWAALKDLNVPMKANPLAVAGIIAPAEGAEGLAAPTWVGLSWTGRDLEPGETLALPGAENAVQHRFTLLLQGHPSALLAAAARLETVHTPAVVRLGTIWKRLQQTDGKMLGLAGETLELSLELAYLDFGITDTADVASNAGTAGRGK